MIPTIEAFRKPAVTRLQIFLMMITALFVTPAVGLSPTRSIHQYAHTTWGRENGMPEGAVLSISETADGYLFIGTQSTRVRFDGFRFTPQPGQADPHSATIRLSRAGRTWVGTAAGLRIDDGERVTVFTEEDGLSCNDVTALLVDKDDSVWVGTRDGVLHRIREGVLERSDVDGMPNNGGIFALAEDRSGALWVGTGIGMERYCDGVFTTFGPREGLAEERILNIEPRRAGGLYVQDGAGAIYVHEDGHAGIAAEEGSISAIGKTDLLETRDGSLWIGGTSLYRFKDGHLETFSNGGGDVTGMLPNEDGEGLLTAQTDRDGTGRLFHFSQGNFTRLYENLSFNHIERLFRDLKKRLWITQNGNGIVRIDGNTQRVFTTKDGLPDNVVYEVVEDGNENYWISTDSGLARIRGDQVTDLSHVTNTPSRSPRRLVIDDTGHLFITADDGIYRISVVDLEKAADGTSPQVNAALFTTDDGLRSIAISRQPSAQAKTPDGNIWIATHRGLSMISPVDSYGMRPLPKVLIETLTVGETQYVPVNTASITGGGEPIEIRFSAPTLKNEKEIQFRYRLTGFEENWTSDLGKRAAKYTAPSPGEYVFEAAVRYRDGAFGEAAVLHLTVLPRWYETLWVKFLFAITASLFLLFAYRLRARFSKYRK